MQKIQAFISESLSSTIAAQKNNLFLWSPFFFATGIAIYFGLTFEPAYKVGLALILTSSIIVFCLYKHQEDNPFYKTGFLLSVAFALMSAGFIVAQSRTHIAYAPMLLEKMPTVGVIGTIETIEYLGRKEGSRVILNDLEIERLRPKQTPRKIRLKIRKDDGLKNGQRIKILAGLNPAGGPIAPGAFDFQRMAFFQGIGAVGFAYSTPEILSDISSGGWLANIRTTIAEKIITKTHAPSQAVIVALMTGQRGAIAEKNWNALRASGLAHLLAISGLHVGMVAGVLFFFSRFFMACSPYLALQHPTKKYAAVIALIGALLYTLIVGATIPTQRALMMTGLVMVAIMLDRSPFSMRLVALAAMVVLFFTPESLTSVSFQMSFAAVVALIYFYELIRPYWRSIHSQTGMLRKATLYFIGVSLTTVIAGTATGLFSLFHFQNYAAYGLIANLVAVPLMAFVIMPLIVLSYALMPFGLEGLVLPIIEWGVTWVLATATWVANLDGAVWHMPTWPHWLFIAMVACCWFWVVWKGRLKLIVIPIFILLLGLVSVYKQPDIMISSKINLIAVRDNSGSLWFSTKRKERYTADNWMRSNGDAGKAKLGWPREGSVDNFPMTCDLYGCRGEIKGNKVSVAFSPKAWREDCGWADIVISQAPIPYKKCKAGTVIDFFDVWREGPHAIWLGNDGKLKVKSVQDARGNRPWTQVSANQKTKNKKDKYKKSIDK